MSDRPHPGHAGRPASAGGGRAASAEAEHHDGRQDALGSSRAVQRGAARAVEPAWGEGTDHGASGLKLYPDSANAHDRRTGVPGVQ